MRILDRLFKFTPRDWKMCLIAVLAGTIVAVITIFLLSPLWSFISAPKETMPASDIIEDLLDFSKNIEHKSDSLDEFIALLEKKCKEEPFNIKYRILLGQQYVVVGRYSEALECFTIANEINPEIADSYYAIGNIYYDLALIDLIRKNRFIIDSEKLTCTLEPDEQSAILFKKVMNEYDEAEKYPTFQDLDPSSNVMFTSLVIVTHRKRQINEFLEGSSSIDLHRMEILRLAVWIPKIFPEDKELIDQIKKLVEDLSEYMKEHPEEFYGIPIYQKSVEVPSVIYEMIDSFEARNHENLSHLFDSYNKIIIMELEALADDPTNVWFLLNLAYSYQKTFQYRKALEYYIKAAEQAPDKADPFIGLGRLYYDLAIFDMINRNLTTTSPTTGLTIFNPDEKTEEVLILAKEMLLISKEKERLIKVDEGGTKVYISPPGTEDEFLEMINSKLEE